MSSEYLDPEDERPEATEDEKSGAKQNKRLESKGPRKDKKFKVLHQDGSLADNIPYNNEPGGGALEGTVGIGT